MCILSAFIQVILYFLYHRQFRTPQDVLNGARHVVAMQIANDPIVRECVRQTFRERAKITVKTTKKGLKVKKAIIVLSGLLSIFLTVNFSLYLYVCGQLMIL